MAEVAMTRAEFNRRMKKVWMGTAYDLVAILKKRSPVDSGNLKNSINMKSTQNSVTVNMVDYALYVEFGTPPHIIRAKNAKALHWKSGGKDHFAKSVRHPGTEPQPFIRSTLKNDLPRIVRENIKKHLVMA